MITLVSLTFFLLFVLSFLKTGPEYRYFVTFLFYLSQYNGQLYLYIDLPLFNGCIVFYSVCVLSFTQTFPGGWPFRWFPLICCYKHGTVDILVLAASAFPLVRYVPTSEKPGLKGASQLLININYHITSQKILADYSQIKGL